MYMNLALGFLMNRPLTHPLPGFYQYTYPTFVDAPQHICVHFLTLDGQQAFVSYPYHRSCKAAQLIPVSWFRSVNLLQLEGQPQLMDFLAMLFTGWFDDYYVKLPSDPWLPTEVNEYEFSQRLMA